MDEHNGSEAPRNPAEHLKGHRWPKGTSGNPGGRPKGASVTAALRELSLTEHNGKTLVQLLAERLFKDALSGKLPAAKEIIERLDGKVTDKHEVSGCESPQMVVLRIPPPRMIGESEDAYQARMLQEAVDRGEVSRGPKKVVVGECWENA
jgi:hypothetical protein